MFHNNISVEFFPPKSEEAGKKLLSEAQTICNVLTPDFFSVTFGAGGSAQSKTADMVLSLNELTRIPTAAHITCIGMTKKDIQQLLNYYLAHNITRLIVLRGDLPSGSGLYHHGDFKHASDLLQFIQIHYPNKFDISIAAYPEYHPQSKSPEADIKHFAHKANLGANRAITQYFYNYDAYEHFIDQANKLTQTPIIPGIMPITNFDGLVRFSKLCGAEIPRWIYLKLEQYQNDMNSLKAFGNDVVTQLCQKLITNKVPGLHFYCLNKAQPVLNILNGL